MVNQLNRLFVILATLLLSSIILPAYAEVTSLQTNTNFYKGGSKIYFTGTTLKTDQSGVTVIIYNPNNQFVLLASGIADSNHTFQIIVDTGSQENQNKFSIKGIYNATAFIANKTSGKIVNFMFSPDGSAMISSPPTNLKVTRILSSEVDLSWSSPTITGGSTIAGYKIERNDGSGFNIIQNTQTTSYQDTNLIPSKQYFYRVSALNSAGTSDPSNAVSATTLSAPINPSTPPAQNNQGTPSQTTNATQSVYELIQQRIENAKRLQQQHLHQVSLTEKVGVGDLINPPLSQTQMFETKLSFPDFNNVLYPLIALAGAGVIAAVLIGKKNKLWFNTNSKSTLKQDFSDSSGPTQQENDSIEEDYSLMILKNRLAKGEITIEEYNRLKDALKEP